MTGQNLYDQLTSILNGENIDQTYALQLFNLARMDFESRRPFAVLKAKDTSQTALAGVNFNTPYQMPSPGTPSQNAPYLTKYLLQGAVRLVATNNPNNKASLLEVPFENQLDLQMGDYFYADYAARQFYILANLPANFTIYQFFIADYGDITLATSWVGFLPRFHPALAFQAAARYRLGTDYDDINARNGDDNAKMAEMIFGAMVKWDDDIVRQQAQNRPFGAINGGPGNLPYGVPGTIGNAPYSPYGD